MKKYSVVVVGVIAALALSNLSAIPLPKKNGTSILHFFVRKNMTNEGSITNASGHVDAKQNQQGKANIQRLDLAVRNLETNASYHLLALIGDNTNLAPVAEFGTDASGRVTVRYRRAETGNGKGRGGQKLGRGMTPLPDALNPISQIRELVIADASTQAVLRADFTSPDKLQYLIKRLLSNDGIDSDAYGSLHLKANHNHTQFRLLAANLETNANYFLALNGSISETNVSDARGRLGATTLLVHPLDILDVRTLAIWDSASNSVLSTHLP